MLKKFFIKIRNNVNRVLATFLFYIFRIFPIKKNKIIIVNYNGKGYGDNAKYIVDELLKGKKYDIVWSTSDRNSLPKDVRSVKYESIKWIYEMVTSKVWINNSRFRIYVKKRKDQFYLQTWHSSLRLKKIELDAKDTLDRYYLRCLINDSRMIDLMISGSDFSTNNYQTAFNYNGEIKKTGTPRCDLFFNNNIKKCLLEKIQEKYNLNKNKKILLYAPTFRKNNDNYQSIYMDLEKIYNELSNEYEILFRFHPNLSKMTMNIDKIVNVTDYADMQELICITDLLVTDYSGCCFDMMIANKPCILFQKDLQDYLSKDRGLYFNLKDLPFQSVNNEKDLIKIIKDNKIYDNEYKIQKFKDKIGLFEDGKASIRISKIIGKVIGYKNEKI